MLYTVLQTSPSTPFYLVLVTGTHPKAHHEIANYSSRIQYNTCLLVLMYNGLY